jgi:4-hydroxy-2-oxoheptanedioate aldolase
MYVKKNLVKEKISKGEIVIGMSNWFRDPRIIELLGQAGYDFVQIENEHIAHNWENIENLIRTAELVGLTPLFRCEQCFDGQPPVNQIIKALECGAQMIMVGHVDTPEAAKKVVDAGKYPPLGKRGIATVDRSAIEIPPESMPIDMKKFIQESNGETMLWVIIESPEGVKNIDEILDVDGIDAVGFGPQDYSIAAGLSSDSGPEIDKAREKVIEAAHRKGKLFWLTTRKPEIVKEQRKRGIKMFLLSGDIIHINNLFRKIIKEAKVL